MTLTLYLQQLCIENSLSHWWVAHSSITQLQYIFRQNTTECPTIYMITNYQLNQQHHKQIPSKNHNVALFTQHIMNSDQSKKQDHSSSQPSGPNSKSQVQHPDVCPGDSGEYPCLIKAHGFTKSEVKKDDGITEDGSWVELWHPKNSGVWPQWESGMLHVVAFESRDVFIVWSVRRERRIYVVKGIYQKYKAGKFEPDTTAPAVA